MYGGISASRKRKGRPDGGALHIGSQLSGAATSGRAPCTLRLGGGSDRAPGRRLARSRALRSQRGRAFETGGRLGDGLERAVEDAQRALGDIAHSVLPAG